MVAFFIQSIAVETAEFTLDEIKEAFAEASKEFEE